MIFDTSIFSAVVSDGYRADFSQGCFPFSSGHHSLDRVTFMEKETCVYQNCQDSSRKSELSKTYRNGNQIFVTCFLWHAADADAEAGVLSNCSNISVSSIFRSRRVLSFSRKKDVREKKRAPKVFHKSVP